MERADNIVQAQLDARTATGDLPGQYVTWQTTMGRLQLGEIRDDADSGSDSELTRKAPSWQAVATALMRKSTLQPAKELIFNRLKHLRISTLPSRRADRIVSVLQLSLIHI